MNENEQAVLEYEQRVIDKYKETKNISETARQNDTYPMAVKRILDKHNIEIVKSVKKNKTKQNIIEPKQVEELSPLAEDSLEYKIVELIKDNVGHSNMEIVKILYPQTYVNFKKVKTIINNLVKENRLTKSKHGRLSCS